MEVMTLSEEQLSCIKIEVVRGFMLRVCLQAIADGDEGVAYAYSSALGHVGITELALQGNFILQ